MITVNTEQDSTTAILNAMQSAASSGDTVYIPFAPLGKYLTTQTLIVPEGVDVVTDPGTVIQPTGDFTAVKIGTRSKWRNGVIDTMHMSSAAAFQITTNVTKSNGKNYAFESMLECVKVQGYGGRGVGLRLDTEGTANVIEYCTFRVMSFCNLDTAIHVAGSDGGGGWINGCTFDDIKLLECIDNIIISAGHGGHEFTKIQCQTQRGTNTVVQNDGGLNRFEGVIWDYKGNIPTPRPILINGSSAKNTIVDMNIDPHSGYVQDLGKNTQWRGIA